MSVCVCVYLREDRVELFDVEYVDMFSVVEVDVFDVIRRLKGREKETINEIIDLRSVERCVVGR